MKNVLITNLLVLIGNFSYCQEGTTTENLEGFYAQGWEYSNFMQLDFENCILIADHWTAFALNLKYKGKSFSFDEFENLDYIYMKVKAAVKKGKSYGHLGGWKSEITVLEIIEIDKTRSLKKFLADSGSIKIKRN